MDLVLVAFIGGLIAAGWRTGFLRRLIGLGFLAFSLVAGAYVRGPFGSAVAPFIKGVPPSYIDMVGYVIAFPALLVVLHVVTYRLTRNVAMTGWSRRTDQALGAAFGGLEAVLIISAAVVILDTYFGSKSGLPLVGPSSIRQLSESLNASTTVHLLRTSTVPLVLAVLGPLLPKDVTNVVGGGLPAGLPGGLPLPRP